MYCSPFPFCCLHRIFYDFQSRVCLKHHFPNASVKAMSWTIKFWAIIFKTTCIWRVALNHPIAFLWNPNAFMQKSQYLYNTRICRNEVHICEAVSAWSFISVSSDGVAVAIKKSHWFMVHVTCCGRTVTWCCLPDVYVSLQINVIIRTLVQEMSLCRSASKSSQLAYKKIRYSSIDRRRVTVGWTDLDKCNVCYMDEVCFVSYSGFKLALLFLFRFFFLVH